MKVEFSFWLYLLLFNTLLFLPRFLMEWKESSFLPISGLLKGSPFERFRYISFRYNYDLFRFCVDLFLFCFLINITRSYWEPSWMQIPFFLFYLTLLFYFIYFNIFDKVFNLPPLFYNDAFMLWHGLKIAFTGFLLWTILAIASLIVLTYFLFQGLEQLLILVHTTKLSIVSILFFLGIFAMAIFSNYRYSYDQLPQQLVQSPLRSIWQNIRSSFKAKENLGHLKMDRLKQKNIYANFELTQRPNIYFLVVESYGRILLDDPLFSTAYKSWMEEHERSLKKNQWAVATALSTPPIVGGASWLSYSSLLYGFRIDNQGTYLALSNNAEIDNYHSFFRYLQLQGFKNFQLNALGGFENMKIPWDSYSRYYGVDEWILYKDLNYNGKLYGFGPSPPDQYSLNFAAERIKQQTQDPFSLFYITQNSHSPFESPNQIVGDWKSLNTEEANNNVTSKFFEKPQKEDYLQAMKYQLDFLMDFVQQQGTENDLFIIVGDHQPPVLTPRNSPQETPVHIIAHKKHQNFINAFTKDGFSNGLMTKEGKAVLKHEGFYSLWMRNLIQAFSSVKEEDLPPYFPNGLDFKD